jgi:diguanylate cyclase (GGDEF)-like protein/PAS domain S-box-containing protein
MTVSANFSCSRRRTAVRILLINLLGASTAFASILHFGQQIDTRRLEQLQVSHFSNESQTVLGNLDSLSLGENVPSFEEDLRRYRSWRTEFGKDEDSARFQTLLRAEDAFVKAVRAEKAVVIKGDMASARHLDETEVHPSFDRLTAELTALNKALETEAERGIQVGSALTAAIFFLSACAIAGLMIRSRRQVELAVSLEMSQQSIEFSERRLMSLVQNSTDVIALVDREGVVSMVSGACEAVLGTGSEKIQGLSIFNLIDPADRVRVRHLFAELVDEGLSRASAEGKILNAHGEVKDFGLQMANLLDDPSVNGVSLTFHDLTERKRFEQELVHHAFHDRLTALPNRALFIDRLTHRLKATESGTGFAVLFIDLDNFKIVNDSLGHEAGDTLLMEISSRIQSLVRPVDTVARLGGDEFTVILDEVETAGHAMELAERIQRALQLPVSLSDREVFVGCSIGVVMSDDTSDDAAGLLRDADTAMYEAKTAGKSRAALYDKSMGLLAMDRMELESDLRLAVQENQFFLVYQPIIDMSTGRVREVEALIRWSHPERGIIMPLVFIPLAEEIGLITSIGNWVLREACARLAEWNRGLEEPIRVSVNVSGRQLQEKKFISDVKEIVTESGLNPNLIELEITESVMMKDLDRTKEILTQLQEIGIHIAIDDFGTGYSSMAYLSQLPIDCLKIDRSFVTPLGVDIRADRVVQAMITMAEGLGLSITGEGIETNEQRTTLQVMGCQYGQGYLFDRPMEGERIAKLLSPVSAELPLAA